MSTVSICKQPAVHGAFFSLPLVLVRTRLDVNQDAEPVAWWMLEVVASCFRCSFIKLRTFSSVAYVAVCVFLTMKKVEC